MFEPNAHVGEDAELYALGQLDADRHERFELHVRGCAECARRVGEAESTVLRLIEGDSRNVPVTLRRFRANGSAPAWRWAAAIAAAFLLGLVPWLTTLRTASPPVQQVAMTAMLHSHFQHTQFVADTAGAPAAKVIFGRTGGWIYVLAAPGPAPLSVVTVAGGVKTTAATLAPDTRTRAAFVALQGGIDEVLLVDGTHQLAHANVVFAKAAPR